MSISKFTAILSTLLLGSCVYATQPAAPQNLSSVPAKYSINEPQPLNQDLYDKYRWSVLYYYGWTVDAALLQVLTLHNLDRWPENIQSVEVAHTLAPDNFLRRLVNPIVGVVQLAGNVTLRNGRDESRIFEFDPYIIFRWANWPWNKYLVTSLGFAEGVSYTSSIPAIEARDNDHTKRFLNYLMFEATFALPDHPQFQVLARVHHRSGAYGLYHAGNTGSNDVGVGIRYLFD